MCVSRSVWNYSIVISWVLNENYNIPQFVDVQSNVSVKLSTEIV
jgi:hypothetical protein